VGGGTSRRSGGPVRPGDDPAPGDVHADNPSSSAYGIPQALPGSKMAGAGSDWEHNPV